MASLLLSELNCLLLRRSFDGDREYRKLHLCRFHLLFSLRNGIPMIELRETLNSGVVGRERVLPVAFGSFQLPADEVFEKGVG